MISFVGAGPGAADLVTLRGAARLAEADVVVWASSLVPAAVLDHCRAGIPVHDSATMTLEDVLAVYEGCDDDTVVVRLHSGDPSLYGAIQEQIDWCQANGRTWELVPGVSSVSAAAACAGRELTIPGVSQSLVVTRLAGRTRASMPEGEGVAAFAAHGATLAVLLSAARPDELQDELLVPGSAYRPDTPAVVVVRATWPDEQVVHTTVGHLADAIRSTGATMTALVLVGDALAPAALDVDRAGVASTDASRPCTSSTGTADDSDARPAGDPDDDGPTGDPDDDDRSGGPRPRRSHLYAPGYTTAYRLRSEPGSTVGRPSARRPGGGK